MGDCITVHSLWAYRWKFDCSVYLQCCHGNVQVGNGQRHLIHQYSLKTRRFIGNTSMEAQMSFLMANQARVGVVHLCHSYLLLVVVIMLAKCNRCNQVTWFTTLLLALVSSL